MILRSSPLFKSCGQLCAHTQLQLAQELDEQIDLSLCWHQYGRENNASTERAYQNGHPAVLGQACERCHLGLWRSCLDLRFAFFGPLSRKKELKQQRDTKFDLSFPLGHRVYSCGRLKTSKAYEENPATLNVRHDGIFFHAEQLLNGEACPC